MNITNFYTLEITTTQKCDMACSYCFEGEELQNNTKQNNTELIVKKIHEMLNDNEFAKKFNGININFWGGEPTLNQTMCKRLIDEFADSPVTFFFYTNGLNGINLMSIINYFNKRIKDNDRLAFQISYDGLWHDIERVDHQGKGTKDNVYNTFQHIKKMFPNIRISLKSVLPVDKLTSSTNDFVENWKHFQNIQLEYPDIDYSPTLEYTQKYNITDEQMNNIKKQLLMISKLELEHYKLFGKFVLSWFGVKEHVLCSAGANISNIDLEGNLSVCHGALYSPDKEDLKISSIFDTDFVQSICSANTKFTELLKMPEQCNGCLATVCYQCPTVNYSNSDKETLEERYHDPKSDLCKIYKEFGTISRTVNKFLKK